MNAVEKLTNRKIWLAPLAGLTDRAFRKICQKNGADVVVSEMVSSDGLVYDYNKSIRYAIFDDTERPIGIQLFGSKPEIMARACNILLPLKPDFIDINMGCPVKKVVKRGAGSALMNNLPLAVQIVREMKEALTGSGIPLSAKIRAGWDKDTINAVEAAKKLEESGIDFITVHPRTRSQMYAGHSDWSVIKAVRSAVNIPVIGNGDITSVVDAERMFSETGCDSIMIGRGSLGKPWIFDEIKTYILTGNELKLSYKEKLKTIQEHIALALIEKEERRALREMRVHYCHYTKGFKGGNKVRELLNQSTEVELITGLIRELYEKAY